MTEDVVLIALVSGATFIAYRVGPYGILSSALGVSRMSPFSTYCLKVLKMTSLTA